MTVNAETQPPVHDIPVRVEIDQDGEVTVCFEARHRCGCTWEWTYQPDGGSWTLADLPRMLDWARLHKCQDCDPSQTLASIQASLKKPEDLSRFIKAVPPPAGWVAAARRRELPPPPEPVEATYAAQVERRYFALPHYRQVDALRHLGVCTEALWSAPEQYVRVLRQFGERERYVALLAAMDATKRRPPLAQRGPEEFTWPLPEDHDAADGA